MKELIHRLRTSMTFWSLLVGVVLLAIFSVVIVVHHSTPPPKGTTASTRPTTVAKVTVPRVTGLPQNAAEVLLQADGLSATVTVVPGNGSPGVILTQTPAANSHVAPGTVIALDAAAGTALPTVPDVNGDTQQVGDAALQAAGFVVKGTQQAFSSVPAGDIISTEPVAHASVPANSIVVVIVSKGPQPVKKPPVVRTTTTTRPPKVTTTTTTTPPTTTTTKPPKDTTTTSTTTTTTTT